MNIHARRFFFLACLAASPLAAQDKPAAAEAPKYTLKIDLSEAPDLQPVADKMEKLFQKHYPAMIELLKGPDQKVPVEVSLHFKKNLRVPAMTAGPKMTFSVEWFQKHPDDLGVIIHELTHTLQAYPNPNPWWVTEGLADYVRGKFNVDDPKVWSLPRLRHTNKFDEGYRVTAAFLFWIEKTYPKSDIARELNAAMKAKKYSEEIWKKQTGKTLAELWQACLEDQDKAAKK